MRRVFRLFALASLALAVSVLVIWQLSYHNLGYLLIHPKGTYRVEFGSPPKIYSKAIVFTGWGIFFTNGRAWGVGVECAPSTITIEEKVDFSVWAIPLLAAMLALPMAGVVVTRKRKPKPGICLACGYDLRATPNRCPECGLITSSIFSQKTP